MNDSTKSILKNHRVNAFKIFYAKETVTGTMYHEWVDAPDSGILAMAVYVETDATLAGPERVFISRQKYYMLNEEMYLTTALRKTTIDYGHQKTGLVHANTSAIEKEMFDADDRDILIVSNATEYISGRRGRS